MIMCIRRIASSIKWTPRPFRLVRCLSVTPANANIPERWNEIFNDLRLSSGDSSSGGESYERSVRFLRTMYHRLFSKQPLLKFMFNMTNIISADEDPRSQIAAFDRAMRDAPIHNLTMSGISAGGIPGAVLALSLEIAKHREKQSNLSKELSETLLRITHAHCSLGVEAHHYDAFLEALLFALDEEGLIKTEQQKKAWKTVVWEVAKFLIDMEQELYGTSAAHGGWKGFKNFSVHRFEHLTPNIMSLWLKPHDNQPLPPTLPGQAIAMRRNVSGLGDVIRRYCVCDVRDNAWQIVVKKEHALRPELPDGVFSAILHQTDTDTEMSWEVASPYGAFGNQLQQSAVENKRGPIVLVGGGVGIAPIVTATEYLVEQMDNTCAAPVHVVYQTRNSKTSILTDRLQEAVERASNVHLHTFFSHPTSREEHKHTHGRVSEQFFSEHLALDSTSRVFMCAPPSLMASIYNGFSFLPDDRVVPLFFGPTLPLDKQHTHKCPISHP